MEAKDVLSTFLDAWVKKNWKEMFTHCQKTWAEGKTEKDLTRLFPVEIESCKILSYTNHSSVRNEGKVELSFKDGTITRYVVNVICEAGPYKPAPYGQWGVNPVSFRVIERVRSAKKTGSDIKMKK